TDRYSFLYTNNETGHPLTEFIVINNYPDDTAKTYYEYIRYPNGTIQYVREYNSKEKLNQNNFYKESKLTEGELFDYVLFKMENMDIKTVYEGQLEPGSIIVTNKKQKDSDDVFEFHYQKDDVGNWT